MAENVDNGKTCAILSYFLVGIIWYFADENMKKNSFAKYHAIQGLNMLIIGIVLSVVIQILVMVTFGLFAYISLLIWLAWLVLWILGIINAVNGKENPVPVIGQFAEKYLKF